MNDYARRFVMDRFRGSYDDDRDYRDYRDYRNADVRDYTDERDYEMDYRRGVRGSGRSSRDYHEMRLTKQDIMRWKRAMKNADGEKGEHFEMMQILPVAEKAHIKFEDYSEKEFCLVVNMLYSDHCEVFKKFIPPDKELYFYVLFAESWLEDEDAPEGSEKLARYWRYIVEPAL